MYRLKASDGSHTELGISNGNRVDDPDGTFWIMGWPQATQGAVAVESFYTLVFPDAHSNSVEVMEIGGAGQGGIRFKVTG